MRKTCEDFQIGHLVERSRSGKGYHIWFFFEEAVPAYIAREFGAALLLKSSERISFADFKTFDRMIPASDHLPINRKTGELGIGNMVALPLQGQALKNGNSAFVDEKWEPFPDQWQALGSVHKLSRDLLEQKIAEWGTLKTPDRCEDNAPWEVKNSTFHSEDIDGKMRIDEASINYEIDDKRNVGRKIKVTFKGKLYSEQKLAAEKMLAHDNGVLNATTAFGKTVLGAYLISKRKVNTLILVHNYEIMKNWQHDLANFLDIRHEIPEKLTPKGRKRKLKSIIGTFKSTSDTTTGIVDIAMISSLGKPGEINELVKKYGMVIMDECHHGAARIADGVLKEVNAKYLYGLTATTSRADGLGKKIFMLLGPERYKYTAKDRAMKTKFDYLVRSRMTNFSSEKKEIYEINSELIDDASRNCQIVSDVVNFAKNGRTLLVVTRFKKHATYLYEEIKQQFSETFILTSDNKDENVLEQMRNVSTLNSLILVATGQYIGEGFNFPRLDTLVLASPSSFRSTIEQYAGRINRDFDGKKDVLIIDYVDENVPMLMNMYRRRKTAYRAIGYRIEEEC